MSNSSVVYALPASVLVAVQGFMQKLGINANDTKITCRVHDEVFLAPPLPNQIRAKPETLFDVSRKSDDLHWSTPFNLLPAQVKTIRHAATDFWHYPGISHIKKIDFGYIQQPDFCLGFTIDKGQKNALEFFVLVSSDPQVVDMVKLELEGIKEALWEGRGEAACA